VLRYTPGAGSAALGLAEPAAGPAAGEDLILNRVVEVAVHAGVALHWRWLGA
jgi:hypothetical protein